MQSRCRGVSLIEMLLVLAITGVLAGLLLPAVQRVRGSAQQIGCRNNLRQIGIALQADHQTRGHLPPGYSFDAKHSSPAGIIYNTFPGWGWAAFLLPQLEQAALAEQIQWDKPVEDRAMEPVRLQTLKVYACPADVGAGTMSVISQLNQPICEAATNSYAASFGYGGPIGEQPTNGSGLFFRGSCIRFSEVTDGLSNTVAVGERAALFCTSPWAGAVSNGTARSHPDSPSFVAAIEEAPVMVLARTLASPLNHEYSTPYDFYSPHPRVMMFLFADGAVRAVPFNVSAEILRAIGTRKGGESISESDF